MHTRKFAERIIDIHQKLQSFCPRLGRMAIAVYDPITDMLKTFVHSTEGQSPLKRYEARLSDVPSLRVLAESGKSRVLGDLSTLEGSLASHSQEILRAGYRSSYTVPLLVGSSLQGFLFFDSTGQDDFTPEARERLSVYAQLVNGLIATEMMPVRMLRGAVQTACTLSRMRDEETANHMIRMAHYARLTALELADSAGLTDETVEYIHQFAPLHDVGKIAIPDAILLKPGRFDDHERRLMQEHVIKGVEVIDTMILNFDIGDFQRLGLLTDIVMNHHERYDGLGYPNGRQGDEIPLPGRIAAVADVLDALTSARPYKKAWSFDQAFDYLKGQAGEQFDPDCVEAILRHQDKVQAIARQFSDDHVF